MKYVLANFYFTVDLMDKNLSIGLPLFR